MNKEILIFWRRLPVKLNCDVVDGEGLDLFDNRDEESLGSIHGHADVVMSLVRDRLLLGVEMTVENCRGKFRKSIVVRIL